MRLATDLLSLGGVLILVGVYLVYDSGLLFHDYACLAGFACGTAGPEFFSGIYLFCVGALLIILTYFRLLKRIPQSPSQPPATEGKKNLKSNYSTK